MMNAPMIATVLGRKTSVVCEIELLFEVPLIHYDTADRGSLPSKDIPLPTQPPYTAFIGNLAFDLTEIEIEEFFGSTKVCHFTMGFL
jgi:hypothetical protein